MDNALLDKVESLDDRARGALLACARMPFASAAHIGGSLLMEGQQAARAMADLESLGLAYSMPRQGNQGRPTKRWFVSADGVYAISFLSGRDMEDLMRALPVSLQWQRRILSRIDAAGIFYQLAGVAAHSVNRECVWHWRGSGWVVGDLDLGERKIMQVARMGPTVSRRAALYRMGSMIRDVEKNRIYGVIIVAADRVQMRLLERWMRLNAPRVYAWIICEDDFLEMAYSGVWSRPAWLGLHYRDAAFVFGNALECSEGAARWAYEPYAYKRERLAESNEFSDSMEFTVLSVSARKMLDALADWPLARIEDLTAFVGLGNAGLENKGRSRGSSELVRNGLAGYVVGYGRKRLCATDEGLGMLGVRDQTQVKGLRRLWGIKRREAGDGFEAVGGALKKLGGEFAHTDGCYRLLAELARQFEFFEDGDLLEILPAHRSERWLARRRRGRIYGVRPDASATLWFEEEGYVPVMIEYERRANTPSLFAEKLRRYIEYYLASLDMEDWQGDVVSLFIFPDKSVSSRFATYCEQALDDAAAHLLQMRLLISSEEEIMESGWLAAIWMRAGDVGGGRMRFWD